MQIALFGTGGASQWREYVIKMCEDAGMQGLDWYSPVIPDDEEWTDDHKKAEEAAIIDCDLLLFVISPAGTGFFTIAELVMCAMTPATAGKMAVCAIEEDGDFTFDDVELASIDAVLDIPRRTGAVVADELDDLLQIIAAAQKITLKVAAGLPPEDYVFNPNMIECIIDRDGETSMVIDRRQYVFKRNSRGHYVCMVPSTSAQAALLRTPENFRRYCPEDCVITPEQKDQYSIFMNADEAQSFWELFVEKFKALSPEQFCGQHFVEKAPAADGDRRGKKAPPDKIVNIQGFVDKTLTKLNQSPSWVRKAARIKWAKDTDAMGVSWAYPGEV